MEYEKELIFSATTRGGKYYIEVYDVAKVWSIYTEYSSDYVNKGEKEQLLSRLFGALFDGIDYSKNIKVDKIGISDDFIDLVTEFKYNFGYLEKEPKGSDERIYYFQVLRHLRDLLWKGVSLDKVFKKMESLIPKK